VIVGKDADCHRARLELAELIEREFDIHHTTLQVEHEPERIVQIEPR
jgi:cobalt-zinc-cadmium efflux system protein